MADIPTSAADIIAAAKAAQEKAKRPVEVFGFKLDIHPATAIAFHRIKRELAQYASFGIPQEENEVAEFAWLRACILEPKFTPEQWRDLRDAAPADFSNLAALCRQVSQGTPLPLLMLGVWAQQSDAMQKEVEAGRLDAGVVTFWTSLVRVFVWWLNSEDGKALDFRALGKDLAGLEDGEGMDAASRVLQEWMEREGIEAKNELGAGNSDYSAPASSGPEDTPTNSPSQDGTGETSTT